MLELLPAFALANGLDTEVLSGVALLAIFLSSFSCFI